MMTCPHVWNLFAERAMKKYFPRVSRDGLHDTLPDLSAWSEVGQEAHSVWPYLDGREGERSKEKAADVKLAL